jgi:hypothetical protein
MNDILHKCLLKKPKWIFSVRIYTGHDVVYVISYNCGGHDHDQWAVFTRSSLVTIAFGLTPLPGQLWRLAGLERVDAKVHVY